MIVTKIGQTAISIHAPREGGDSQQFGHHSLIVISIHAPREGGDTAILPQQYSTYNFNPRPPRGGRPLCCSSDLTIRQFQSTPPARGATAIIGVFQHVADISIHAPREGGDSAGSEKAVSRLSRFQSTPPARGATTRTEAGFGIPKTFQSTPPARGATSTRA